MTDEAQRPPAQPEMDTRTVNILDTTCKAATPITAQDKTAELRLQLLANGYTPLANLAKVPVPNWPRIEVTEELIVNRWKRMRGKPDTGIRFSDDTGAADFDVQDAGAMGDIRKLALARFDTWGLDTNPWLRRIGRAPKEMWLFKPTEPFEKMMSKVWVPADVDLSDKAAVSAAKCQLELFGGLSGQMGAYGAHSYGPDGEVLIEYEWTHDSPLDVPADEVPELSRAEANELCRLFDDYFRAKGWQQCMSYVLDHETGGAAFILNDDMQFFTKDGDQLTLAEIEERAERDGPRFELSPVPWLRHGSTSNGGILVGRTATGDLTLYDFESRTTYMKEREGGAGPEHDVNELVAKMVERKLLAPGDEPVYRPVIRVTAGELDKLATQGEKALIGAGAPIYVHGSTLKRPVVDDVEASKGRMTKVARLAEVTAITLVDHMCRVAKFEKYDGRAKKFVPTNAPREVAEMILSRDGEWHLRRIVGVVTTPTLRPDGSILSEPGYDPATRLVLIDPPAMPSMPEQPRRDDALAALDLLNGLLAEFSFVDEASRSVALSELITPVVRGALTVAPMHVNTAPEAGSGKSYIVDIASAIASGHPCPVIAAGRTEEETEKRLGAQLMKGQSLISIDNLNGDLSGDALCQYIERPVFDIRVLGLSKDVRVESRATLFATGNNIKVVGDIVRRTILCSLDTGMERPETKQFKDDPVKTVLADRGLYIAAALTVVRAYTIAGCPGTLPVLQSFGDWSRMVRSALVWLGRADPVVTMEKARADDPERSRLRQIVAAWYEAAGVGNPLTTGALIELAESKTHTGGFKLVHQDLRDALRLVASPPGRVDIDALRLGKWLGQQSGRIVGDLKIERDEDRHAKKPVWYLTDRGKT